MDVTRLRRSIDLESVHEAWQGLAEGNPLRGWHWQSAWWTHYGHGRPGVKRQLWTLVVSDGPTVVAIAPWLVDQLPARGRVIRFLGEDEVCTDYTTILCRPEDRNRAAAALTDYLTNEFTAWDALELAGVEQDDAAVNELVAHLAELGQVKFNRQEAFRCWRLALPTSWDVYLPTLAKSFRRRLRKLQRDVVEAGRLSAHYVTDAAEFDAAWKVLVDLHQRRRQSLGQPGCFASRRFAAFHEEVARRLLQNGQLELVWFELDGRPVSAEYNLLGPDTTYTYQGGIEPERIDEQPGHLGSMHTLVRAIDRGHAYYDFLRGDEPYKAQWRAAATGMHTVRVVPQRAGSQIREAAYLAVGNVKDWLKSRWQTVRESTSGAYAS